MYTTQTARDSGRVFIRFKWWSLDQRCYTLLGGKKGSSRVLQVFIGLLRVPSFQEGFNLEPMMIEKHYYVGFQIGSLWVIRETTEIFFSDTEYY